MKVSQLLTVEEVASRLGLKVATIRRRILRKKDRLHKIWAVGQNSGLKRSNALLRLGTDLRFQMKRMGNENFWVSIWRETSFL